MENNGKINAEKAWEATLGQLKMSMDRQTFTTLLGTAKFVSQTDDTFVISVQNAFTRDWLEQRLTETIVRLLSGLIEVPQQVKFVIGTGEREDLPVKSFGESRDFNAKLTYRSTTINSRYTFDNFVIGSSNNLAHAACRAVAEIPSAAYNPLFIYSGVGLGKTHLLHAVGNQVIKNHEKNVLYVSSEEFTNDFISSIQRHENTAFREKYRNADVLLMDDIQFIIGKESTQEEFFHTFNTLYQQDKQIVITSDRSPKSMSTLDERMRSRFEWGLTVDIQSPDLETRIAILSSKADRADRKIPMDVLELIARQIQTNIRELEGALTRVLAVSDLCRRPLDRDLVLMSLADMMPVHSGLKTNDIVSVVAKTFGVSAEKIMSRDRTRDVALSRQVVMYLMREEQNISLPQIGQAMGGRDHSTVIHACEKIAGLLERDNRFRRQFDQVRDQLYGIPQPVAS